MKPLWKVQSGQFAGWLSPEGALYAADGMHVGYVTENRAFSVRGRCVGEILRDDWIGLRVGTVYGRSGIHGRLAGISHARPEKRQGLALASWKDPEF